MREQLIRYLLGELDADERRELRAQLRESPELQRELTQLRACFAANHDDEEELPPGHLAERTADRISNSDEYELEAAVASGSSRMSQGGDAPTGVLGWSLADLTVAGGVMLAVSMLVFPALRDSRDGTRTNTCKNNLAEMYFHMKRFANDHGGILPQVRPNQRVGVIPLQLVESGIVEPARLRVLMLCPASAAARSLLASPSVIYVPSPDQLRLMTPTEVNQVVAQWPACFTFRLPQVAGDDYFDSRDDTLMIARFDPIFGDMAGDPQDPMTSVHRGSVYQLMNRDGSIIAINMNSPPSFGSDSDLFHNNLGVVAAALSPHDVVLAPCNAMPGMSFPH